jgi:hypothetical protein
MQAVILGMLGISELHRRNASPEHICCASALKAKLSVDEIAELEAAKASAKLTLRTVQAKKAVIFGSIGPVRQNRSLMADPAPYPPRWL